MSAFTVVSGSEDRPNWLEMRPAHFDTAKLPRKHRKPDPGALFSVVEVLPETPAATVAPQLDGQADLFSGLDE
jgi:hypothetical protein